MRTRRITFNWQKASQAFCIAAILLFACLSQFALAKSSLVQESPVTPTPTSTPLTPPVTNSEPAQVPLGDEEREALLRQTARELFAPRLPSGQIFEVGLTQIAGEWAFVNWRVSSPELETEPEWQVYVGLARWDGLAWTIALEGSPEFIAWLDQIPAELIPLEARPFLKSADPVTANAPGLWLPFPVGQTWKYIAGPNGGPRREAVDFGPFSLGDAQTPSPTPVPPLTGQERDVTAAATGIVIDRGPNFLILRHGSAPAWETGYASLAAESNIFPLGQVVYQGQRLGAASAAMDSSKGNHVHFWVRREGVDQVMAGQLLSDWQVYQDNSFSVGPNSGRIVYRDGVERIDCLTVGRLGLAGNLCHVHHASLVPAPLPVSTVSFSPTTPLSITLGSSKTITVQVESLANLYAVKLRATYTPTLPVMVIDAWSGAPGLQVAPGSIFSNVPVTIIQNTVDPQTGVIEFEVSRQVPAPTFTGSGSLISLALHRSATGPVALTLDSIELTDPNGQILPVTITTGTLQIIQSGFVIEGQVELQGRRQSSGVTVTTADQQVQTDATGHFKVGIEGSDHLSLTHPGYLSAQAEGNPGGRSLPDAATLNLGRVTLLAGEVTGDEVINILDLAFIANDYGRQNILADLNNDGVVNILDLTLAAANYGQQGPRRIEP